MNDSMAMDESHSFIDIAQNRKPLVLKEVLALLDEF